MEKKILVKVKEKLSTKLRQKIKPKQPKPVLSNPDVKKYREKLYPKFFIVTDKASNKFAFICRKYYAFPN